MRRVLHCQSYSVFGGLPPAGLHGPGRGFCAPVTWRCIGDLPLRQTFVWTASARVCPLRYHLTHQLKRPCGRDFAPLPRLACAVGLQCCGLLAPTPSCLAGSRSGLLICSVAGASPRGIHPYCPVLGLAGACALPAPGPPSPRWAARLVPPLGPYRPTSSDRRALHRRMDTRTRARPLAAAATFEGALRHALSHLIADEVRANAPGLQPAKLIPQPRLALNPGGAPHAPALPAVLVLWAVASQVRPRRAPHHTA